MSIAAPSRAREQVLSAQFNQDFSCVAVGTTAGYLIANCEPYAQVHAKCTYMLDDLPQCKDLRPCSVCCLAQA